MSFLLKDTIQVGMNQRQNKEGKIACEWETLLYETEIEKYLSQIRKTNERSVLFSFKNLMTSK